MRNLGSSPIRRRLAAAVLVLTALVHSAAAADEAAAGDWGGAALRWAWIAHRLAGDLPLARGLYEELLAEKPETRAPAQAAGTRPNVRARACLGLALLERDAGNGGAANRWLDRALAEPGAAERWRQAARHLQFQLARGEVRPDPDLVSDMKEKIARLEAELETLSREAGQRGEELRRRDELIARLESGAQGAAEPPRSAPPEPGAVGRLLESMLEAARQEESIRRYMIGSDMSRAREYYQSGRTMHCYNELKKVLSLDPYHSEALELSARCRSLLASAIGERTLSRDSAELRMGVHSKRVLLEVMDANYEEGRRLYQSGKLGPAIGQFQKVLEEYAWSPATLSDEEVATFVQPAQHMLDRCYEESGIAPEAWTLRGREESLAQRIRERTGDLEAKNDALEAVTASLERWKREHADQGVVRALGEMERRAQDANGALQRGEPREAAIAARDILTLLELFPELDPNAEHRDDIARLLRKLQAPAE